MIDRTLAYPQNIAELDEALVDATPEARHALGIATAPSPGGPDRREAETFPRRKEPRWTSDT